METDKRVNGNEEEQIDDPGGDVNALGVVSAAAIDNENNAPEDAGEGILLEFRRKGSRETCRRGI